MKLTDIINPWGALKQARSEIADYKAERALSLEALREAGRAAVTEAKAHILQVKNLKAEIHRLEQVVASGHYRNPETGRLGRKGERFDAGAKK
jgi:D-aminopeptidase